MGDLRALRDKIRAAHEGLDKYDGAFWQKEAACGRGLSSRPVAFIVDDMIVLLREDAEQLAAGLDQFLLLAASDAWRQRRYAEPTTNQAVICAERVAKLEYEDELCVPQQWWNSLMFALTEVGMNVVLSDGAE